MGAFRAVLRKEKTPHPEGYGVSIPILDSPGHFAGTEATGAYVDVLGGTVDDRLDTADVGLPATVGPSVRVRHTDAEGNTLTAVIAFCHCSAPPSVTSARGRIQHSLCGDIVIPQSNGNSLADNAKKIKCFLQGF